MSDNNDLIDKSWSEAIKGTMLDRPAIPAGVREALQFYADEINHARVHISKGRHCSPVSDVMLDEGHRAREALALIDRGGGT